MTDWESLCCHTVQKLPAVFPLWHHVCLSPSCYSKWKKSFTLYEATLVNLVTYHSDPDTVKYVLYYVTLLIKKKSIHIVQLVIPVQEIISILPKVQNLFMMTSPLASV